MRSEPRRLRPGIIAEYVTESDTLAAVEAGTIREISGSSKLHEAALERFGDIADGLGSSLNSDYTPPLRLANVHQLPGELSEEIKLLWRRARGKRGFRVTVDEYGAGTVILFLY